MGSMLLMSWTKLILLSNQHLIRMLGKPLMAHIAALFDVAHETFILGCVDKSLAITVVAKKETPIGILATLASGGGSKSKNLEYCSELLKYMDMIDSDDDGPIEWDMDVLPPVALEAFSLGGFKRSLLDSMEQATDKKPKRDAKNTKWGPLLAQKPVTRNHANVNIIDKAATCKWKTNEVPPTYQGNSFVTPDNASLGNQAVQIDIAIWQ